MDYSRAWAYCSCSGCGWGLFGHFYSHLSFLFPSFLSLGDGPIATEILSQRAVKPNPTKQATNLFDFDRARAYCACSRCGWGLFGHLFLSSMISLLPPSLRPFETVFQSMIRYRNILSQRAVIPKQRTNQPFGMSSQEYITIR